MRLPGVIRQHRSAASTGVVSVAAFGLAAAMLTAPGYPISSLTMHDGSVWVTKSSEPSTIGRLNRQVDRLDAVLSVNHPASDVLQNGSTVIVTDPESGVARTIDVAYAQLSGEVPVPNGAVIALGGQTVAVLDPATGDGWTQPEIDFRSADFTELEPMLNVGEGGKVAVGADGTAHFLGIADNTVVSVRPDGELSTTEVGSDVDEDAQLSAVGDTAVVLSGDELVVIRGGADSYRVEGAGDGARLQQAGPDADRAIVAGSDAVIAVALDGGGSQVAIPGGSGAAVPPVVVAGCVHAAWSGNAARYARSCGQGEPVTHDLDDGYGGGLLKFRVNRNVVALNDTGAGFAWVLDDSGDAKRIDNWNDVVEQAVADDESQQESDQQEEAESAPQCSTPSTPSLPPTAENDTFGVRRGQPAVLPVTANDTDPDSCDVVAIVSVDQPPSEQGRFDIVGAGSSLQFTPSPDPSNSVREVTTTYTISDGRGQSDSAAVTVTIIGADDNRPPQQLRESRTTVEAGKQVSYNVLSDWKDDDGDPLLLVAASSDQVVIRWSSDGLITVVDAGTTPGRIGIPFVVDDGRASSEGVLRVDVQPAGAAIPPTVRGDYAVGFVGGAITIMPLANDTDANSDPLRLVSVTQPTPDGAVVSFDSNTGRVVFTASRADTFRMEYQVSDGGEPVTGTIRVDVQPVGPGHPPVAVLDKAQVAAGGTPTVVEVLANDVDADGDPLAVVSAEAPAASGLVVSVVDFARLRIVARTVLTAPVAVTYRITDGLFTVAGTVIVTADTSATDADQPPIARADQASVRVGDVVDIHALANDTDPEGAALTIDRTLVESPESGLLFVAGDRLRYVAGPEPGTVTAVYQVIDRAQNTATARVSITVLPEDAASNRPPQPEPVTARLVAGSSVDIAIPLSGIDPDGDSAFLVSVDRSPNLGTLAQLAPGASSFNYQTSPDLVSGGLDEFRYRVSDRFGAQAVGVVRIVILPRGLNQPPVTIDDVVVVKPGRTVSVPVLANDTDPDGDTLTLSGRTDVPGVTFGKESITVEVPSQDGKTLNIQYVADDQRGGRTPGLLSVTASSAAASQPPIAVDDAAPEVAADATEVTVDVLANDSDPDGTRDALSVSLVNGADGSVRGNLVTIGLQAEPRLVPYSIKDPDGNVAYALVSVPGASLVRFPVLKPGTRIEATIGEPKRVAVADVVTDPLGSGLSITDEFVVTTGAGTAAAVDAKTFTFTPSEGAPASAKVGIAVRTDDGRTSRVDVPFRILSRDNREPVVTPAALDVPQGAEARLPLAKYASDPDGDTLTFSGAEPQGSALTVSIEGSTLVVAAGVDAPPGPVTVTYQVSDGVKGVAGTVNVNILQTDKETNNRPLPRAVAGPTFEADQGKATKLDVLANDFNPFADDGEPLTIDFVQVAARSGQVSTDGSVVTFTSAPDFFGTVTLTYRVRDAAGRTSDGQESIAVSGPPAAPGAPRVDRVESHTITLTWVSPATNNGAAITGYRVESENGVEKTCPATTCVVDGLTNGTKYRFRVSATNSKGQGPASTWSAEATPDQVPDAPTAPTVQFGDRLLDVSWKAPSNGGTTITDYIVSWNGQTRSVGNVLRTELGNLANGTAYDVTVTAVNAAGKSDPSGVTRETPATAPTAPAVQQPTYIEGQTGSTLRVAWAPGADGGSALTSVVVTPYKNGVAQANRPVASASATSDEFLVDNDGAQWSFSVTVTNKAGSASSAESARTEVYVAPGAPTVSATAVRNGVTFAITPPVQQGGKPITGYLVRRVGSTTSVAVAPGQTKTNSELGINTLGTSNVDYTFEVQASNGKPSQWAPSNAVRPFGNVQRPTASITGVGQDFVTIRWDRVTENGRPVTNIMSVPDPGAGTRTDGHSDSNEGKDVRTDRLICATTYTFRVVAIDSESQESGSSLLLGAYVATNHAGPPGSGETVLTARTTACPPTGVAIAVNAANTYGDTSPVPMRQGPSRETSDLGSASHGTGLTARCWVGGQQSTDGSDLTSEDDSRTFTSSLWYGVDWNGGRAYISAAWSTKSEDHLGLPGC